MRKDKENTNKKKSRMRKTKGRLMTPIMVKSAISLAKRAGATALFVYGDISSKLGLLMTEKPPFKVIIVSSKPETVAAGYKRFGHSIKLPHIPLTRMGQIKISVIMAASEKIIKPRDTIVFLTGRPNLGVLDSIVIIDVAKEFSLLASREMHRFSKEVDHSIFNQVVRLAIEIANEGREGHPVGTIFILGDTREVTKHVEQMIINPFKGHSEEKRQILNPEVSETIKELAQLDGAFIIRPNGVIETAGVYIAAQMVPESLPAGLGARHYSAAAITAATNAITITVSQSTGDVHIFKGGQILACIEKA
jgi:diadenylate cyclase